MRKVKLRRSNSHAEAKNGHSTKLPRLLERDIQKQITDWLDTQKVFWYRNNTGAVSAIYGGRKRFVRFGTPGAPDIVAVFKGRYVAIEVKRPGGTQSEDQWDFEQRLRAAGGCYILAHSLTNAQEAFIEMEDELL